MSSKDSRSPSPAEGGHVDKKRKSEAEGGTLQEDADEGLVPLSSVLNTLREVLPSLEEAARVKVGGVVKRLEALQAHLRWVMEDLVSEAQDDETISTIQGASDLLK